MRGFGEGCTLKIFDIHEQIQNGCLSAIILFHMPGIWQTILDGWTITIKQNVKFQGRMHPEIFLTRSNLKWPSISHYLPR